MGIHMPCKTVIFAGENMFLSPLSYNQMAGRAGRRGFDSLGNIIFFGVPLAKIVRVTSASVPELRVPFPFHLFNKFILENP
jgi:ATP-dependent RNA helicase DDX60